MRWHVALGLPVVYAGAAGRKLEGGVAARRRAGEAGGQVTCALPLLPGQGTATQPRKLRHVRVVYKGEEGESGGRATERERNGKKIRQCTSRYTRLTLRNLIIELQ